jgi:hypothetical protein
MYYIGLGVHKKTISYCVKDAAGGVHCEGKIGSGFIDAQTAMCPAGWRLSEGVQTPKALHELFWDWQRMQTQSSVTAPRSPRQQMDVRFCKGRNYPPRGIIARTTLTGPNAHSLSAPNEPLRNPLFSGIAELQKMAYNSGTTAGNGTPGWSGQVVRDIANTATRMNCP